jgi:hypothetical protein
VTYSKPFSLNSGVAIAVSIGFQVVHHPVETPNQAPSVPVASANPEKVSIERISVDPPISRASFTK